MTGGIPLIVDICRVLEQHGDRLALAVVASAVHAPVDEVRREIQAFGNLESDRPAAAYAGDLYRLVIDPVDELSDDPAPSDDDWVVLNVDSEQILGIHQFDAAVLGPLYAAAEQLLAEEPGNEVLRQATERLRLRFLPGVQPLQQFRGARNAVLRDAIERRRRVRIVYSRQWNPGLTERVIEPYELVHTSRGPEVDAGPVDGAGQIRTFLVHRIRELEVLDEAFERPADATELSVAKRALTRITGFVPPAGRWVLDKWAERVTVVAEDPTGVRFVAHVLPPVGWRCGLMMLMAGPTAWLDDVTLDEQRAVLARRLLEHHGLRHSDSSRG